MEIVQLVYTSLLCLLLRTAVATYVSSYRSPNNPYDKAVTAGGKESSLIHKRKYSMFKSNREIMHYLKLFGTDMMIWRCKNAIQPYWDWKPLPVLELDCETIGIVRDVEWYHKDNKIDLQSTHYSQTIRPHMAHGKFFSSWLDFNLKIYNATTTDSGMYSFKAVSNKGFSSEHTIYVDISGKKRKKKNRKKNKRKYKNSMKGGTNEDRDFNRFYLFHKYHNTHRDSTNTDNVHTHGYGQKHVKTGKNTYYTI